MDNTEKIAFFCLLSLYNRGGGETPSEQGLCRESASDFGTFHPQKFSKLMVGLGLGDFIFDCLGFGGKKAFLLRTSVGQQERTQEQLQVDLGPAGLSFLGTVMGDGFRGEGWFVWRKARSLGTEAPTVRGISCTRLVIRPRQEKLPPATAPTPASIFPSTGAKNYRGKEEKLYISNIKSLGD